jgi:hypothetical protein
VEANKKKNKKGKKEKKKKKRASVCDVKLLAIRGGTVRYTTGYNTTQAAAVQRGAKKPVMGAAVNKQTNHSHRIPNGTVSSFGPGNPACSGPLR